MPYLRYSFDDMEEVTVYCQIVYYKHKAINFLPTLGLGRYGIALGVADDVAGGQMAGRYQPHPVESSKDETP